MNLTQFAQSLADRYTIEREIGAGGMATVYLARDVRHDRDVAIKVLLPELAATLGGDRFLAEIKTTAKLQHPHILPLLDSGGTDGLLYYVMPYVAGETLRRRLEREGTLPIDEAMRIAREVADALGAAHALGIIHRDIKPENILLQGGHALVADFGIALAVQQAGAARMTQTGLSLGTPQYMSPEQAMGEKQLDLRADIYALGAVTYEMLVGDPPFTGSSVQAIIAKLMTERPTAPRTIRETVPPGVEAAVMKALAKLPADRFASAEAFSAALASGLSAEVTLPPRVPGARRDEQSAHRWRRAAIIAFIVALAASAAAVLMPRGERVRSVLVQRQITFEGNVVGTAISPDGLWIAYLQDDCETVVLPTCTYTLQVREVDGVQAVRIAKWQWINPDLHWSGDGRSLVFRGSEQEGSEQVFISDRLGGTPRRIPIAASALTIGADGHTLIAAFDNKAGSWLKRYDIATLAAVDSARIARNLAILDLSASPIDGTLAATVVIGGIDHKILLLDENAQLLDSLWIPSRRFARWDSAGSAVLTFDDGEAGGLGDDLLRIAVRHRKFDRSAAPSVLLGQLLTKYEGRFDVARSGRLALLFGPTSGLIHVRSMSAAADPWRPIATGVAYPFGRPVFTPDSRALMAGMSDNLAENLYVIPLDGSAKHALTSYHGPQTSGARWAQDGDYSPDGRRIVFARGNGRGVDVAFTDSAGGRDRVVASTTLAVSGWTPQWLQDDIIVIYRNGAFVAVDTNGTARDSVVLPVGMGFPENTLMNRAERSVYFTTGQGIATADFPAHAVRMAVRSNTPLAAVGWSGRGEFLVTNAAIGRASGRRAVYVVDAGMRLREVSALPPRCVSVVLDRTGTMLSCVQGHSLRDVWLAVATSR